MNNPKVSVIIPVFNGADYIGEAIQSVLDQTYSNFEMMIVNDASTDNSDAVIKQFNDPRIKYLVQKVNQGVDAARLAAIRASSGDIFVLLDQDDFFHREKLEAHVKLMEDHPELGFSYNARFELDHSAKSIRGIWRVSSKITLADLILGFPIAPSDMVLRRRWINYLDQSDEHTLIHGGEYVTTGRLFMSGCKFGSIDRALNYRRYHSGRTYSKLSARCESELEAQQRIFDDPRCPAQVLALRDMAFKNTYRIWSYFALIQDETALGQEYLEQAVRLIPSIIEGKPSELTSFMLICSIDDENQNHEVLLKRIFAQLPPAMAHLSNEYDWAVARGYLIKGMRSLLWDRLEDGHRHMEQATRLRARLDESLISQLTRDWLNYEMEYGNVAVRSKIRTMIPYLEKLGGRASVRKLLGCFSVNQAFESYRAGEYASVPGRIVPAIANDPKYLVNRGVLSIFIRSILGLGPGSARGQ